MQLDLEPPGLPDTFYVSVHRRMVIKARKAPWNYSAGTIYDRLSKATQLVNLHEDKAMNLTYDDKLYLGELLCWYDLCKSSCCSVAVNET